MRPVRLKKVNKNSTRRGRIIILGIIAGVTILGFLYLKDSSVLAPENATDTDSSNPLFDKTTHSTDEANSLWAVVNKGRTLPSNYIPSGLIVPPIRLRILGNQTEMQLRQDAAAELQELFKSASNDGLELMLASGYRSYSYQDGLYAGYVRSLGQENADNSSARPGHSEHQTGLAADIGPSSRKCELEACFASTPEGKWLAANSYKFGFIIRYFKGAEKLTGYEYEPWHIRYVGKPLAQQLHISNKTMEQFFGMPVYADYPSQLYSLPL